MVFKLENPAWFVATLFIGLFTINLYIKQQIDPEPEPVKSIIVKDDIHPLESFWYTIYSQPKTILRGEVSPEDAFCLAQNIHHESGAEPFIGKLAVGIVTLNRKNRLNKTICEVVFEPKQFSWTHERVKYDTQFSEDTWLATNLLLQKMVRVPQLQNATYFHNGKVKPFWIKNKEKILVIGRHTFYAEK